MEFNADSPKTYSFRFYLSSFGIVYLKELLKHDFFQQQLCTRWDIPYTFESKWHTSEQNKNYTKHENIVIY